MKHILAPTDFSNAAHNAVVYAASLAKVFNARLTLYHAYRQILPPDSPAILTLQEIKDMANWRLEQEAGAIDLYSQLAVETISNEENEPATGILQAARDSKADMIVMGMKGSGKNIRRVVGSTVTSLIRKTTVPVIVVPEAVRSGKLETIALATESDVSPESDPHILDRLRELGERFSSKLYLIRIAKNKFAEAFEILNRPFKISKMLSTLDPVYESIEGKDVIKALNEFTGKYRVNMLALLPHKHSLPARLLGKSTTRSMVFETKIPLLILPDPHREPQTGSRLKKESTL